MKKTPIALCLSAICLGLLLAAGCAEKEEDVKVLKLVHGLDTTHPVHKAMVFMADRVKEKSAGRLRIDIYPSEQLGSVIALSDKNSQLVERYTYDVFGEPNRTSSVGKNWNCSSWSAIPLLRITPALRPTTAIECQTAIRSAQQKN